MDDFFRAYANGLAMLARALAYFVIVIARPCAAALRVFARALPWLMLDAVAGLAILWFAYGAWLAWPPAGHMVIAIELFTAALYLASKFAAVLPPVSFAKAG